jgi:hypothetical protein
VAEIVGTNAPFGHVFHDLPDPCVTVARLGTSLRWDRKTNRLALDDRRRSLAGGAIEALSAKNHPHASHSTSCVLLLYQKSQLLTWGNCILPA